jgi:ketosteroid isomerase-like protein
MSQENVDLVRSIFADWERGDYSSAAWADPKIEYVWADGPTPGTARGHAGMAEAWRAWLTAWGDFRAKADDYRVVASDQVLVLNSFEGSGKTSGVGVANLMTKGASHWTLSGGKVTRLVLYWDRDRALVDLGLTD